jgi:hypothetical protein
MLHPITRLLASLALLLSLVGCANFAARLKPRAKGVSAGPLSPGDTGYLDPGPFSGPLAQKYAGQFVFSSKPISAQEADDSSVYASYNLGEPLYIRTFDRESPHNLKPGCKQPRRLFRADVNGKFAGKVPATIPGFGNYWEDVPATRGGVSLTYDLATPLNTPTTWSLERESHANSLIRTFNSGVVAQLQEGPNTVHLVMTLDCGTADATDLVAAEGTLSVNVAPGAKKKYLAKFGTTLGPSPHPENAKLAPQIIKVMKNKRDWDNEDFMGAEVVSDDWQPIRNQDTGALVAKSVVAALVVHSKEEPNPDVCRLFTMSYARDVAGGALYFNGTGQPTPFPCANAPK